MIKELVKDFISGSNVILTAPPSNGCTTVALTFANYLINNNKSVIYYNPTGDIDRQFIKENFPKLFTDMFLFKQDLSTFMEFLDYINYDIDHIIIDPGDILLVNRKILPLFIDLLGHKIKLLATSQIRQDPTKGGQIYSPLEVLNKSSFYSLFDYSIWIRNVSEADTFDVKSRYIDVFQNIRTGNEFIRRYILKFDSKTGEVIVI